MTATKNENNEQAQLGPDKEIKPKSYGTLDFGDFDTDAPAIDITHFENMGIIIPPLTNVTKIEFLLGTGDGGPKVPGVIPDITTGFGDVQGLTVKDLGPWQSLEILATPPNQSAWQLQYCKG